MADVGKGIYCHAAGVHRHMLFLRIQWNKFILFPGEGVIKIHIKPSFTMVFSLLREGVYCPQAGAAPLFIRANSSKDVQLHKFLHKVFKTIPNI